MPLSCVVACAGQRSGGPWRLGVGFPVPGPGQREARLPSCIPLLGALWVCSWLQGGTTKGKCVLFSDVSTMLN